MDVQTDTVAQTMGEALSVTCFFDHPASYVVHVGILDTRRGRSDGRSLSLQDDLVDRQKILVCCTQRDRPGHIGAVAIHAGAEIEQNQITLVECSFPGRVVDVGRQRAGTHYRRERDFVGARETHPHLQIERHLLLGYARNQPVHHPPECIVGNSDCLTDEIGLVRILDPAQSLDRRSS